MASRKMPGDLLATFVVCVIAASGTGLAASVYQVEASLVVSGSVEFAGAFDGQRYLSGAIYETDPNATGTRFSMDLANAHLSFYNFPYVSVGDPDGPIGSNLIYPLPEEKLWEANASGRLRLESQSKHGALMLFPQSPSGDLLDHPESPVRSTVTPTSTEDPFQIRNAVPGTETSRIWSPTVPAGVLTDVQNAVHRLTGPSLSVLYGGTFELREGGSAPRLIVTGESRNASLSVTDPSGTYGERRYDRFVLLAEDDDATITINSVPGLWRFAVRGMEGAWEGDLTFAGTEGHIQVDGRDVAKRPQQFQMVGSFEGRSDYTSGSVGSWSLAGPATFVGIDGLTVAGVRPTKNVSTVAAVAGFGLLAFIYVAVSWIRRGAVYIAIRILEFRLFTFAPFAARLDLAKVLDQPVRRGIMDMLAGSRAMWNLADLRRDVAAAYGISSWTAYFHLRTLWRANHLTVVRMGGQHFIGPNSGGMGSREQRVAASLLHHPVGLAIAEFVTAHPGAAQKDIVSHVQAKVLAKGQSMSYGGVLKWIRKFETTKVTPTHLVRAFGTSLNPDVDPKDVHDVTVTLIVREPHPHDARVLCYRPTDILYDVVKAFTQRRPDLGAALTELTRIQVQRRSAAKGSLVDPGTHNP